MKAHQCESDEQCTLDLPAGEPETGTTERSNSPDVPALVTDLQRLWEKYVASEKARDEANRQLAREEREARGLIEHYQLVFGGSSSDSFERARVAKEAIEALIDRAEEVFAPEGGCMEVNRFALHQAMSIDHDNYETLDLRKAWALLEENYGGTKGHERGHRQNATKIVDAFRLKYDKPTTVGGMVVMNIPVRVETAIGQGRGAKELAYHYRERVQKGCSALRAFMETIGESAAAADLERFDVDLWNARHCVQSRKTTRTAFGQITTYYERFEFRLVPHIAQQLQVYLGTFAEISGAD